MSIKLFLSEWAVLGKKMYDDSRKSDSTRQESHAAEHEPLLSLSGGNNKDKEGQKDKTRG